MAVKHMQKYREKLGTNRLISAPRKPVSKKLIRHVSGIIGQVEEILEAHLAEVITIGSADPAVRTLFLVFRESSQISAVMDSIGAKLANVSREEEPFEVWPISQSDSLLATIRSANSIIGWRD